MTGQHADNTRGSRAAVTAISGPIPDGSPAVSAIVGNMRSIWTGSNPDRYPIGDDFRAGVAIERVLRGVDRGKRGGSASRIDGARHPSELGSEIRIRERGRAAGRQHDEISKHRRRE